VKSIDELGVDAECAVDPEANTSGLALETAALVGVDGFADEADEGHLLPHEAWTDAQVERDWLDPNRVEANRRPQQVEAAIELDVELGQVGRFLPEPRVVVAEREGDASGHPKPSFGAHRSSDTRARLESRRVVDTTHEPAV